MSLKKHLFVLLFISCSIFVYSQTKPRLGILPFSGGTGNEGEALAEMFSYNPRLIEIFDIIPRTGIATAISQERYFQLGSGMTNPDTIILSCPR